MSLACPHCLSEAPGSGAFCLACGKALPVGASGPRILGNREFATSSTGQAVQSEELRKKVRSAFGILLTVSIIQLLFGAVCFVIGLVQVINDPNAQTSTTNQLPQGADLLGAGIVMLILGFLFLGIAIWCRWMPLAAAITGMAIYGLVTVLDVVMAIASGTSPGGLFIRAIILVALGKAIQAGFQHRELKRRLESDGVPAL